MGEKPNRKLVSVQKTTYLSPILLRQLTTLEPLKRISRLNADVSLDGMSILFNDIDQTFLDAECVVAHPLSILGYKFSAVLKHIQSGLQFTVCSDPTHSTSFAYRLKLNPKSFSGLHDVIDFLETISGKNFGELDHKLTRIDLAIDCDERLLPPFLIERCMRHKWKQETSAFRRDARSGQVTGVTSTSQSLDITSYLRRLKYPEQTITPEFGSRI